MSVLLHREEAGVSTYWFSLLVCANDIGVVFHRKKGWFDPFLFLRMLHKP